MQINLNNAEIEKAIVAFIADQGINLEGKKVEVQMVAGRGRTGHSANVIIAILITQSLNS